MLTGVMVLALAIPLACWGLAARTARTGRIVALVLGFCAGAEIVVAKGWLLAGERFTVGVTLASAAAAVLAAGIAAEWRQAGGPWRGGVPGGGGARRAAGGVFRPRSRPRRGRPPGPDGGRA